MGIVSFKGISLFPVGTLVFPSEIKIPQSAAVYRSLRGDNLTTRGLNISDACYSVLIMKTDARATKMPEA